ncbi:LrgB-domain-containing protein [Punctularia strigosozonata HHB-11173 SS5]|uniref:LrgB-domain-containing protein n=1 Tax=Punctularia strigosozonata (strain HHB-11173) TaxID=741275 RepID=UPI0004416C99|nr:LrgB-domain-containing protein [Punctularia strigosozonata HHB-11173 SS5]EIN05697.1 LrgB-domain-containing protein [Punctularia strigosozonata HHB-11173 SS5]
MQTTLEVTVTAAHPHMPLRNPGHDSRTIAHDPSAPVHSRRRSPRLSMTLAIPKAFWICIKSDRARLIQQWVIIPVVILVMLVYVWAVNLLMVKLPFTFPASVVCMLLTFIILSSCSAIFGHRRVALPLRYLEPAADFLLKWISVFFCPSFILLPLNERNTRIGGLEIAKIILQFFVSFVVFVLLAWAFVKFLLAISPVRKIRGSDETMAEIPGESIEMTMAGTTAIDNGGLAGAEAHEHVPEQNVTLPEPVLAKGDGGRSSRDPVRRPESLDLPTSTATPELSRNQSQTTLVRVPGIVANTETKEESRPEQLAPRIRKLIAPTVYGLIFLVSIPVFYTTSQSLPLFLSWNILMFIFSAEAIPTRVRRVMHPILTCSVFSVLGLWAMGAIRGWSIFESLDHYSTGTKYLQLFDPKGQTHLPPPGAGDVLTSVLDASIVSLAIPMYRYRAEMRRYWFEMLFTVLPLSLLSVFIYPLVSRAILISPSRALAFAARSVTTPLAIPMEASLQGDSGFTVLLCIFTGILGAIAGPQMLRVLRVKDSDFITIGVVLGCTASAISTAALLGTNPRAAAISSLAFVLYGISCIILTSIPPVVSVVQMLAGLR